MASLQEQWDYFINLVAEKQKQGLEEGRMEEWVDPTGRKFVVHSKELCDGNNCVFHNPTEHNMREWPIIVRETGLIERRCLHGIGHPDPDSLAYLERTIGEGWGVHGCDGCCWNPPANKSPSSTG